jgi:glycosyltransferase involved in cell wall biosynthesis
MKPKLLFVLPDLAAGGAHFMNVRLTQQLQQRGWHVDLAVLFRRDEVIPAETLSGLEVHRFNATNLPTKLAALARLAQLAKRYDLVVGGMEFAATNYGYLAAQLAQKPFLSWTHIAFAQHQLNAGVADRAITQWVYRRRQNVVFVSHGALESLRLTLGEKPENVRWQVIENFIDPSCPTDKKEVSDKRVFAKPVVAGIGRLASQKAFDRLIRVHAALRNQGLDHHLLILGEGPLRRALSEQASALGVFETVFMPGHVTHVAAWLSHAAAFALCSRYEGFALVLLEALSCGVPAVAMDCPAGPREILDGGRYGLLVPDGDEVAMTEALGRLLRDANLRAHYAELGKERAKHYSAERIVPQWEALFEQILTEQGQRDG